MDTSVWLDLAKRRDGQRWIVPLRVLAFQGKLELLVPSLVLEEFGRNRPRAETAVTSSVSERFVSCDGTCTSTVVIPGMSGLRR
jgi:hypothetical protein